MRKTSTQWYNHGGYDRRPRRYFVEYILSDGSTRTADYETEDEARTFAERLGNPKFGGGSTLSRIYRVWRGKEIVL